MIRMQIYLTEQQHRQLQVLSRRKGASLSELIRGAIDHMLLRSKSVDRLEIMRQYPVIRFDSYDLQTQKDGGLALARRYVNGEYIRPIEAPVAPALDSPLDRQTPPWAI
jgi:ribbon-helix-helix CopG family protein